VCQWSFRNNLGKRRCCAGVSRIQTIDWTNASDACIDGG
jgi:hypothetical protein